jgi:molybdopterin-containing oxidoreductase family iron-sulfur binding subunit
MKKELDRREFVKIGGIVTAGAAVGFTLPLYPVYRSYASAEAADLSRKKWGMIIDVTKCPADCTECLDACRKENNVAFHDDPRIDIHYIRKATVSRKSANAKSINVPLLCNHCDNPPCALVCPVQATYKRPDGIVVCDAHRCIGCRYCLIACPYNMRMFSYKETHERPNPRHPVRMHGVSEACHFCYHRLGQGMQPACVEACNRSGHRAMTFGNLNDPTSEASRVVANRMVRALREDLGTKPKVFYIGL